MPALLADFAQVFTTAEVFTPLDLAARGNRWPSIQGMLAGGKRLLVVSGVDYLTPMAPLIFSRCSPCCAVPASAAGRPWGVPSVPPPVVSGGACMPGQHAVMGRATCGQAA